MLRDLQTSGYKSVVSYKKIPPSGAKLNDLNLSGFLENKYRKPDEEPIVDEMYVSSFKAHDISQDIGQPQQSQSFMVGSERRTQKSLLQSPGNESSFSRAQMFDSSTLLKLESAKHSNSSVINPISNVLQTKP